MGMMIDDDVLYLHTSGNFGHTSSPGIWCVISNALLFMCLVVVTIFGVLKKYVDDYNGFGSKEHATRDEVVLHQCARAFLGQTAINESKTVHPTQHTEVLGWDTDLPAELCSPNTKGCNKLLVVFFCFDVKICQSYNLWEVLTGVAERYSTGLVGMKAFVAPFHHMKHLCGKPRSGRPGRAAAVSSARFCIEIWRAEAVLLWHDRSPVAVPLRSMTR